MEKLLFHKIFNLQLIHVMQREKKDKWSLLFNILNILSHIKMCVVVQNQTQVGIFQVSTLFSTYFVVSLFQESKSEDSTHEF